MVFQENGGISCACRYQSMLCCNDLTLSPLLKCLATEPSRINKCLHCNKSDINVQIDPMVFCPDEKEKVGTREGWMSLKRPVRDRRQD